MEFVTRNNGVKMPILGCGVYQVSNAECERCVLDAISVGYRSIDTAQACGNEIQNGVVVIPKTTHKERMIQNMDVFDFTLDQEDLAAIQAPDEAQSLFFSHYDPAVLEMLTGLHR